MRTGLRPAALLCALLFAACTEDRPTALESGPQFNAAFAGAAKTYVVLGGGNSLPDDFAAQVSAAGGSVTAALDAIGVAVVTSENPGFAAQLARAAGVQSVVEDVVLDFGEPTLAPDLVDAADAVPAEPAAHIGAMETFRMVQWAPDAVSAPAAWHAGYRGAGARVAILDGGIRDTHWDIKPNLDVAHSASFVPNQPFNFDMRRNAAGLCALTDTFWHGTHVAGIVAAAANDTGTVGIAPSATLIGVKVLHCGSGSFSWIIQGIVYAATPIAERGAGANIINMSLGALVLRSGPGIADLLTALGRATMYANQRGVTVIAAAGNNAVDIDHTANIFFVPAQSPGVIAVSATAPVGWALGSTDLDVPTTYTNYGQSAITFAGPGGDAALPGNAICSRPRLPSGSVTQPCWVFDLVMAPCRGSGTSNSSYCWASGTSMASPAVAGVAALIVGKYGSLPPAQVEALLRRSADDLGKPGNDDYYGRGRVNAERAVQ